MGTSKEDFLINRPIEFNLSPDHLAVPETNRNDKDGSLICSPRRAGKYLFLERLAVGRRNEIHRAVEQYTGEQVIVKVLRKGLHLHGNKNISGQRRREGKIHAKFTHPHVLPLAEVIEDKDRTCLVMKEAKGGDLRTFILNNSAKRRRLEDAKGLPVEEAQRIFKQLVQAVQYIHKEGYVHRDIKPENVFLDEKHDVLLGDFGLACRWTKGQKKTKSCGTQGYLAPCLLNENPSYEGPEVDCWSLGACLYYMLHGRSPFSASSDLKMYKKTKIGKYNWKLNDQAEARDLVARLLEVDRSKRATLEEVLSHPFLNSSLAPQLPSPRQRVTKKKQQKKKKSSKRHACWLPTTLYAINE